MTANAMPLPSRRNNKLAFSLWTSATAWQQHVGHNLQVIGTLGVLDAAAARGWIDLPDVFSRLRQTTFRLPQRLMTTMLEQDAQRKKGSKKD